MAGKPILTISSKDFFTGLAPNAHSERGGLFFKASGVTPSYDPGSTESVENGLLQPGPAPTNIGGSTVVDTIFAAVSGVITSTFQAFFQGNAGHIYRLLANGTLTDLRDGAGGNPSPVSNAKAGIKIWGSTASGGRGLLYWQSTQFGLFDGTTWDDDWSATIPTGAAAFSSTYPVPHIFEGDVFWNITNTGTIGAVLDSGGGALRYTASFHTYDIKKTCFSISDDGVYLVLALSDNQEGANVFGNNEIVYINVGSGLVERRHSIKDPFIWKLVRVGNGHIAFGQKGVYQVLFGGGVTKLPYFFTAFGTPADVVAGYGTQRATAYNQEGVVFATDTNISSIGKLSPELPSAYLQHFKVPSGVGTPTLVFDEFAAGSIYVATDGNKFYRYDFNGATRETGVTAQTVYFSLPVKMLIKRIEVIFGEPLASGDAFDIDTKIDEDTSAVDFDSCSFAVEGPIRRKVMTPRTNATPKPDSQLSLVLNWTAGAAKVKKILVFGEPQSGTTE